MQQNSDIILARRDGLLRWAERCALPVVTLVLVSSVSAWAGDEQTDERLSQKVTYEAKHKTILTILADLSEMTGVTLRAGYNNNDWQVRDRRMNVFAEDVPLSNLMNSIARVMKFKWRKNDEAGPPTYRLYMDRRTLLEAEAERARSEERAEAARAEGRKSLLEDLERADSLSEQDLARMKDESPFLYVLCSTGIAGGMAQLLREVPALSDVAATGQRMTLLGADLSPEAQQGLLRMVAGLDNLVARLGKSERPSEAFVADIGQATIDINGGPDVSNIGILVGMHIRCGDSDANLDIPDPSYEVCKTIGKALIEVMEGDVPLDQLRNKYEPEAQAAIGRDVAKIEAGEPPAEHPNDPALQAKVKMTAQSKLLPDVLSALAECSGLAVVSDSFGKAESFKDLPGEKVEIKTLLDAIASAYHYNWYKPASAIEFRDRRWFRKRSAQIPEAWLEKWRQVYEKTGTLDLGELGEIASLTHEQLNLNIKEDEVLGCGNLYFAIIMNRDVLRMYAALTGRQGAALFSKSGLDLGEVSPEQRQVVEDPIIRRNPGFLRNPDARVTITATRGKQEGQFEYSFTATTSDDLPKLEWKFVTPKYVPPVKQEDQGKQDDTARHSSGWTG